ncbi:MAG: rhomboid family intramembrane serine protease [Bacteroidota bacterium]
MLRLTDATRNLIYLNIGVFVIANILMKINPNLFILDYLFLNYFGSPEFKPPQIALHFFMHGDFFHLLFNLIGLFFLGPIVESILGQKRFILFYFLCAFGAVLLLNVIDFIVLQDLVKNFQGRPEVYELLLEGRHYTSQSVEEEKFVEQAGKILFTKSSGASGAIYGLLVAIGVKIPNVEMQLFPLPVRIKAKYIVIGLLSLALIFGFANIDGDSTNHFAHLFGGLFGWILLKTWKIN